MGSAHFSIWICPGGHVVGVAEICSMAIAQRHYGLSKVTHEQPGFATCCFNDSIDEYRTIQVENRKPKYSVCYNRKISPFGRSLVVSVGFVRSYIIIIMFVSCFFCFCYGGGIVFLIRPPVLAARSWWGTIFDSLCWIGAMLRTNPPMSFVGALLTRPRGGSFSWQLWSES